MEVLLEIEERPPLVCEEPLFELFVCEKLEQRRETKVMVDMVKSFLAYEQRLINVRVPRFRGARKKKGNKGNGGDGKVVPRFRGATY